LCRITACKVRALEIVFIDTTLNLEQKTAHHRQVLPAWWPRDKHAHGTAEL
jgi:hypothetical protein